MIDSLLNYWYWSVNNFSRSFHMWILGLKLPWMPVFFIIWLVLVVFDSLWIIDEEGINIFEFLVLKLIWVPIFNFTPSWKSMSKLFSSKRGIFERLPRPFKSKFSKKKKNTPTELPLLSEKPKNVWVLDKNSPRYSASTFCGQTQTDRQTFSDSSSTKVEKIFFFVF